MLAKKLSLLLISYFILSKTNGLEIENIVGGSPAETDQFNHQITLYRDDTHVCGGAIISDTSILTAAHCVIDEDDHFCEGTYKIVAGVIKLDDVSYNRIEVGVKIIYAHKLYDRFMKTDDVAVLTLSDSLKISKNPNLKALNVADGYLTYVHQEAIIAGFGWDWIVVKEGLHHDPIEIGGSQRNRMNFIKVKVLKNSDCLRLNNLKNISKNDMCAQAVDVYKMKEKMGVCTGDSGSSLIYGDIIIGILSSSPLGCDETNLAALYMRVSGYTTFIKNAMKNKKNSDMRIYVVPKERQLPLTRGKP